MNENNLWLERWEKREIGFNQNRVNAFLIKYFKKLNLEKNANILVPLCGKSIDIAWFLSEGFSVTGIELSEIAVEELFLELGITPSISNLGEVKLYSSEQLNLFVGDIFKITSKMIGEIDAIYDRAAIVALTKELRIKYAEHLRSISNNAPQLLLCFEYDQSLMNRTPYSVDELEVKMHYAQHYEIELLERVAIAGGFKGKLPASDVVWLLKS